MNFRTVVASATLGVAACTAFAQETPAVALLLTPTGASSWEVSFERAATGLFVDNFSFTPASFAGVVAVHLSSLTGPVSFFSALLNGEPFSVSVDSGQSSVFDFQSTVTADTPLSLQVLGFAGDAAALADASGSYSGRITAGVVSAVPEPGAYALLLGGLAGLAATGIGGRRSSARKRG